MTIITQETLDAMARTDAKFRPMLDEIASTNAPQAIDNGFLLYHAPELRAMGYDTEYLGFHPQSGVAPTYNDVASISQVTPSGEGLYVNQQAYAAAVNKAASDAHGEVTDVAAYLDYSQGTQAVRPEVGFAVVFVIAVAVVLTAFIIYHIVKRLTTPQCGSAAQIIDGNQNSPNYTMLSPYCGIYNCNRSTSSCTTVEAPHEPHDVTTALDSLGKVVLVGVVGLVAYGVISSGAFKKRAGGA